MMDLWKKIGGLCLVWMLFASSNVFAMDANVQSVAELGEVSVYDLFEGQDGVIYVASSDGLFVLRDGEWSHLDASSGLSQDKVIRVYEDVSGAVWVAYGREGMGVSRLDDGEITSFNAFDSVAVFAICETLNDQLLVGGLFGDGGLFVFEEGDFKPYLSELRGIEVNDCRSSADGDILVATMDQGFFVIKMDESRQNIIHFAGNGSREIEGAERVPVALDTNSIRTVSKDDEGVIWFSFDQGGGLVRFDPDVLNFKHLVEEEGGLNNDHVLSLQHIGGRKWVATYAGACSYDRTWSCLDLDQVQVVLETDQGIFLGTRSGLYRLPLRESFSVASEERKADASGLVVDIVSGRGEIGIRILDLAVDLIDAISIDVFREDELVYRNVVRDLSKEQYVVGDLDEEGTYRIIVEGISSDGEGLVMVEEEVVLVRDNLLPPLIQMVFPKDVVVGREVVFDASMTVFSSDTAAFTWEVLEAPVDDLVLETREDFLRAAFIPVTAGRYVIQLRVEDALKQSDVQTYAVDVVEASLPLPIASVGEDFEVMLGDIVKLDGSGSQFSTESASYEWTLTSGPVDSVTFDTEDIVRPTLILPQEGVYTFSLMLRDELGRRSNEDEVVIGVNAFLKGALYHDLPDDHVSFRAFSLLKQMGVIRGYEDGAVRPFGAISRVELLKLIFLAFDLETSDQITASFSDVDQEAWYGVYVDAAVESGIVRGFDDGQFRPNASVSRIEALKMVMNAAQVVLGDSTVSDFEDVEVGHWAVPYIEMSARLDLFPLEAEAFYPNKPLKRFEAAMMIEGLLE